MPLRTLTSCSRSVRCALATAVALTLAACAPVQLRPAAFESTSTGAQARTPLDFETVPGLEVRFTTTTGGPVTVWFFGNVAQLPPFANTAILFRLMVDGTEVISGSRVRHDFVDGRRLASMVNFHWTVPELSAGDHRVSVEWIAITGTPRAAGNATIDARTLTVAHAE